MEHQFVPQISLYRLQNAVFELHVHLYLPNAYLAAADVELTRHGDCLLVSGNVPPYIGGDYYRYGHEHVHWDKVVSQGTVVWTDQPCGRFGRSVPVGLNPGTEYVILDRRVECGDYVVRYTLRNTPRFVGNTCTSIRGDVSQDQLRANSGFNLSAPVSSQAETHVNAYHHLNPPFHSSQPFVPYHSQPTSTQVLDGFSAGTGVNVRLGDASAKPSFNVGGSTSGTAGLATVQTVQVTQEVTQPPIQQTTQTATLADSSGQYDAGFVSGQMQGQATEVITLAGSEDVQLGSVVTDQVASGSTQGVGNENGEGTLAGSSGQYNAGFVSGQTQGEATELITLAGSEDAQLRSVVTGQVASGSTQGVGQVSSVQQTTQVAAEQATRVTPGQIMQETTQSSIQAEVLTEIAQSSTQQTTQTATELNAEFANTSGLVNVAGSSGQYVGGDVTVGLNTGSGSTLDISAGAGATVDLSTSASANFGLSATVSSGQTAQVPTDQVTQQTTEVVTQRSAQTSEIDGMTMNAGSRQVARKSTRGVGQLSSVEQTTQTSTELDVETRNESGLVTVAGSSAHYSGQVPDQTQSSVQQTTQSSTQQTMQTSAELDVKKESSGTLVTVASSSGQDGGVSVQTQGEEVVGVAIINGGEEVQHELETRLEGWESMQGVGLLSSARQTMPFFSRQVSQASTDSTLSSDTTLSSETMLSLDTILSSETALSSTQQTKEISTELGVRTGNTDDGASVQTQEETVGIAIVQGGEDVSVTGQVSTQGVIQSSSVQQTIQSSSEETDVDLEQVSQIPSVQFRSCLMRAANWQSARASTLISGSSPKRRRKKKRLLATIQI